MAKTTSIRTSRKPAGKRQQPEYHVWYQMHRRCYCPHHQYYKNYGARGIVVSAEWVTYDAFIKSMGRRPSPFHTLDRIDNDGPYSPDNCRWATRYVQSRNRTDNHVISWRGETHVLKDWSTILGMGTSTLAMRLQNGWTIERAFTTPVGKQGRRACKKHAA